MVIARDPVSWFAAPESLSMESDEVHLWRACLDVEASRLLRFEESLSADEQARATRYHFRKDRQRFVVARGLLRAILGTYLDMAPGQMRFSYSIHGKPTLAMGFCGGGIQFNLSHSHGLALFALTRDRQLGVDLELIRPQVADEQIAERFFSPREVAALRALPSHLRAHAFFACWTRKEAYIKARGEGLSMPLEAFSVSLVPGEPAALLDCGDREEDVPSWSLRALAPAPDYLGALAADRGPFSLRCGDWPVSRKAAPAAPA